MDTGGVLCFALQLEGRVVLNPGAAVVQEGLPCWVSGEMCASSHAAVLDASLVALERLRGCGVLDDRLRVSGRSRLLDELRESRLRRRDIY